MLNAPTVPDHGLTFELETVARELRAEATYGDAGQNARTLVRTPDLRVVLIAIQAGKAIAEHHANVTAMVQTLSGRIHVQLPDRRVDVPEGHLFVMGAGLPHEVTADTDSTLLLTLGWPATK